MAWEASGRYICTASDDMTLRLWDTQSGACLRTLEGHTHYVFCCAFNPVMNALVRRGAFPPCLILPCIQLTQQGHQGRQAQTVPGDVRGQHWGVIGATSC